MFCRCLKPKHYDLSIVDTQLLTSFIHLFKRISSAYNFPVLSTKNLSVKKFINGKTICSCSHGVYNPVEEIKYNKEISKSSDSALSNLVTLKEKLKRTSNHWQIHEYLPNPEMSWILLLSYSHSWCIKCLHQTKNILENHVQMPHFSFLNPTYLDWLALTCIAGLEFISLASYSSLIICCFLSLSLPFRSPHPLMA